MTKPSLSQLVQELILDHIVTIKLCERFVPKDSPVKQELTRKRSEFEEALERYQAHKERA